jgi:hypothetical protein
MPQPQLDDALAQLVSTAGDAPMQVMGCDAGACTSTSPRRGAWRIRQRHDGFRPRRFGCVGICCWRQAIPRRPKPATARHWRSARRQSAKRAATSLARLWRDQGNRTAAHELLAPVYDWFTEGFGTPVLQEAKALLDELL